MPTGCLPLIWDERLRTPSGERHVISEWVAVEFYAAAKYGLMGGSARALTEILLLRELAEFSFPDEAVLQDFINYFELPSCRAAVSASGSNALQVVWSLYAQPG